MSLARLVAWGRRNAGAFAAIAVASVAAVVALAAIVAGPRATTAQAIVPRQAWPWWRGRPTDILLLLVTALFVLGLAAFIRRPHSGIGQALLAGAAGNAASVALWSTITAEELTYRSPSWLAFVAAGFLSLLLWSSLVHLVFVFPTRDRWIRDARWLVPAIYLAPPAALAAGAAAIGAFDPTSLAWVEPWARVHAAIVSSLLVVVLVGIAVRFRAISRVRRRQTAAVAASVSAAVVASLALIDLPILIGGAPLVSRETVVLLALPVPILLAVALWNDRNFRFDRLRRSQMALLHAREEERLRLRRDLHDGLGPSLAAIGLKVDAAASWVARDPAVAEGLLAEVRRDLNATLAETRHLVRGLRPPALDELGLASAIKRTADEFSGADKQPEITVSADGLPTLPAAVEVAAYRIVQESLTNAVRHAHAAHLDVHVGVDGGALRIEVEDDGTGYDTESRRGVGTEAMRERVEELGGDCWIASAPDKGTRVLVTLPLSPG